MLIAALRSLSIDKPLRGSNDTLREIFFDNESHLEHIMFPLDLQHNLRASICCFALVDFTAFFQATSEMDFPSRGS